MRLLILGKNGQVGWELMRALSPLGEIVALDRSEANFEHPDTIRRAVAAAAPDVIVNAAAYTAVDKAESEAERANLINHRSVAELASVAAARGAWLLHYSTDYVFDGRKRSAYTESDVTAPQNVYGRTKRDGELAIAAAGPKHLIFRTSWVHAPRGRNFVRTMLRLAAERDHLRVVADQHGAPTSAELIADVTAQAVAAIGRGRAPASGVYHLAASGETSWHGLAQFIIAEAIAAGAALRATPDSVEAIATKAYPTPAARPANSLLDGTKIQAALGIVLPDWRLHVRRTVFELVENSQ